MSERAQRVVIRLPGGVSPEPVELQDGERVLVGRDPDWSRLEGTPGEGRKALSIAAPSVSANHVLVQRDGERVSATDLGSRNGTWLALGAHRPSTANASEEPITLCLAPSFAATASDEIPNPVPWTNRDEYLAALETAVKTWLDARDLPARVAIALREPPGEDVTGRIPAAPGAVLIVEPTRTVGVGWHEALARIERFVAHQKLLFETEETMRAEGLVVASPAMRHAVERVLSAVAHGARVLLLTGPSGAGKEGLARCFHRNTGRGGPFVARNCAMFSKDLVRAELFGAERGAFTGSVRRLAGAVERANEGTLFLDELGELPREVQPMLLRFLDHGEYHRLGDDGEPKVADVRIVAATNRDLRAASASGDFRTDLWFRLSVHVVDVPPLRERPEDVRAYLKSYRVAGGGSLFDALAPAALDLLAEHEWEGNFRELVNFAERSLPLTARAPISADAALRSLQEGALQPRRASPVYESAKGLEGDSFTAAMERARAAFAEDHEGATPRTWDQIKGLVENYLKPLLFAELTETSRSPSFESVDVKLAAEGVRADRGTAMKQLRRYFDRFPRDDASKK